MRRGNGGAGSVCWRRRGTIRESRGLRGSAWPRPLNRTKLNEVSYLKTAGTLQATPFGRVQKGRKRTRSEDALFGDGPEVRTR